MTTESKIENTQEEIKITPENLEQVQSALEEEAEKVENIDVDDANEETVEELNNSSEGFKAGLIGVGQWIGNVLGFTQLQASINVILEKALDEAYASGNFKSTMVTAEAEMRRQIKAKIASLKARGGNTSLKKAVSLQAFIGDDEALAGTGQGIIGAAISGLWWVADKFVGVLKKLFRTVESKNDTLKAICGAIRKVYGYIRKGFKFIVRWTGRIISWTLTGLLAIGSAIGATICWIYLKIRTAICKDVVDDFDDFDDFEDDDEEIDDEQPVRLPYWFMGAEISDSLRDKFNEDLRNADFELEDVYYEKLVVKTWYNIGLQHPIEGDVWNYIGQFKDIQWDNFSDYYKALFSQAPSLLEKDYIRKMANDMSKRYPERNKNDFINEILM